MILKIYNLPLFRILVVFGSRFTVTAKTQFGLFRFRPVFVNEMLMALGLYEPHVKEVFRLEKGQTFLDVGSNIGFYALHASLQVGPTGRVVSIEANPDTFRILSANVMGNCSVNTIALCCGVGSEDGFSDLFVPSNYPAGSRLIQNENKSLMSRAKVPVTTIDSLVSTLGIKRVDWIKIDVEGMESAVIAGSRGVLQRDKPRMMIETMNIEVVRYLRASGYRVLPLSGVIGLFYAYPNQPPQTVINQRAIAN